MNGPVSVFSDAAGLEAVRGSGEIQGLPPWSAVLMVSPDHFRVQYAINPHMTSGDGALNEVDAGTARRQWEALRRAYEAIGYPVHVLPGSEGLPDMVFAANQAFPFPDGELGMGVALSRMRYPQRAPEVPLFEGWFSARGCRVDSIPEDGPCLEGCGDLLWVPGKRLILGGYGFRTERSALDRVSAAARAPVLALRLTKDRFYHLDTCLAPIDQHRALWVPDAFDSDGHEALKGTFRELLEVPSDEAEHQMVCNAHCPDGRHVLIEAAASRTIELLRAAELAVIELETSEFRKAGGSVFCMKQMLF